MPYLGAVLAAVAVLTAAACSSGSGPVAVGAGSGAGTTTSGTATGGIVTNGTAGSVVTITPVVTGSPSASGSPAPAAKGRTTAAKTRTTSKKSSSAASASGGNGTAFKGIAGPGCADVATAKASWYYNWWITPSCSAPGFVPMISGKKKAAGDVSWQVDQVVHAGYRTMLGFNEPNKADQSNMTVAQAVSLWPMLTANRSIRVGSPVTSTDGQAWFTDFISQAEKKHLRVDFIALHWYGWSPGSCDAKAAGLESYLRWAEGLPGHRPIWITELGCMNQSNPDPGTVQKFYRAAAAMLARHPRVERYAWYPWLTNNALIGKNGGLTALGATFAKAPSRR